MTFPVCLLTAKPLIASSGIYAIIHRDSGKLYVGSALSLARRHGEHQRMLRRSDHENDHLQKAWNKYGCEAFTFTILLICAPADLLYYEQRALDYFKTRIGWRRMYNANPNAGSNLGGKMSTRARALLLERLKGNQYTKGHKLSSEHKAKISVFMTKRNTGHRHSEATKAKIAAAHHGKVVSAETRAKISAAGKGRKFSDQHRANLANSPRFSGKRHSEHSREKISRKLKGRVFSEEYRAKISAGVRAWRETLRRGAN